MALPEQSRFFEVVTTRPVAVICVVIAFLVFGGVAYSKLQTTLMPDLEYPQLTIRTNYPAAAPSEVEDKVSLEIEDRIGNVEGLVERTSVSRAEKSDVILKFAWGTNMLDATADVRDRLDRIGFDDSEVDRPQILRYDPAQDPTMRLVLFATNKSVNRTNLRAYAEDILKPELQKIEGVAAVRVSGGEERQIRIFLKEQKLNQFGLTAGQVIGRIRAARVDSSAGIIELGGRDVILRVVSTYESLDVLKQLEVSNDPDAGRVTLEEIAEIKVESKERETITRFMGDETKGKAQEGVLLEILKEGDANIIETSRKVWIAMYGDDTGDTGKPRWQRVRDGRGEDPEAGKKTEIQVKPEKGGQRMSRSGRMRSRRGRGGFSMGPKALIDTLPEGYGVRVVSDQSYFIEDAVEDVTNTAILGALLAVLVLFFFLRSLKATALIAVSIPLSITATFIPLQMSDVTLNLMSLGGLALGVGMLVDNSVVVIESISRCREEGDPPLLASVRGISEVGGAIFASTMTTVAVFFPIVFVEGIAGRIFRDLSLTVVFSLLASLVVAQFVVPAMFGIGHAKGEGARAFGLTRKLVDYILDKGERTGRKALLFRAWRALQFVLAIGFLAAGISWMIGPSFEDSLDADMVSGLSDALSFFGDNSKTAALAAVVLMPMMVLILTLPPIFDAMAFIFGKVFAAFAFVGKRLFWPISKLFDGAWKSIELTYPLVMRVALRQPALVFGAAMLAGIMGLAVGQTLDTELMPHFQQNEIYADIDAPEGTRIASSDAAAVAVSEAIYNDPALKDVLRRMTIEVGGEDRPGDAKPMGPHRVRLVMDFESGESAEATADQIRKVVRTHASENAMFQSKSEFSAPSLVRMETGVEIEIRGDNYERLGKVAERVVKALKRLEIEDGVPLLRDVRSSVSAGRPQVRLRYNRSQLQRYGLSAEQVSSEVRSKIGGEVSTQYSSGGEDIEVFVELQAPDKRNLEQVRNLEIAKGVRLREVLVGGGDGLTVVEGPSEIRRVGNERAVLVRAEPNNVALSAVTTEVETMLGSGVVDLEGADVGFSGQVREMQESTTSLIMALTLAIFLVYVVMAIQFESLIDPLVIIFSVPFAAVGVVLALAVFGLPISVMVLLGMIVLAGIVVNNAIVMVSYANMLLQRGQSPREAALNAARIRLRPITITTLTTLLGLLPMTGWIDPFLSVIAASSEGVAALVQGGDEGAAVRKPLAITVIAGLSLSTLLTLIVIPTIWAWVRGLKKTTAEPDVYVLGEDAAAPQLEPELSSDSDYET
ncbi:MAG: efflux RND transporter permease subunit [Planctomycetota bacterium]|jgi:HAE1 family hydrophobic/amphiphilic exporter-1